MTIDKSREAIETKFNNMSASDRTCTPHFVSIYASATDGILVAFDCRSPIELHDNLMKKYRGSLFFAYFNAKSSRTEAEVHCREFNKQQKIIKAIWQDAVAITPELSTLSKYEDKPSKEAPAFCA